MTAAITIDKTVTITTEPGAAVTLERGTSHTTGPLFDVSSPAGSLTLSAGAGGALILDGGYNTGTNTGITSDSAAITAAGELTLENGVTVKNNKNGSVATGGVVFVDSGGRLTMDGGSVEYNEGGDGGGVAVRGYFEMNGGTIQHNRAEPGNANPDGGGVIVDTGGNFVMAGGEIAFNYAERTGGGVAVYSGGSGASFTMTGGSIHDNTADGNAGGGGGGVHVWRGTFTVDGTAAIYNNTAVHEGGGVCVYQSSTFNMNGGNIFNNTTSGSYGGVYNNGGTLSGSATIISSNTPNDKNF
jgi:hypothetical protein